ncbi:HAD-IIB family hydrolase [Desulfogranum japonicum]|uniref:HAD-IIB family hydrolase n=1 Tax=Desulfogranum japonicum TaxID=231447 RepID=UPI00041D80A6|nr:HAD family hydrolase [Desulfogranum japonicum]
MSKTIPSGIFITDLDGTLLTDTKTIRHQEFANLYRLQRKNICIALATGRSWYSLQRLLATDKRLQENFRQTIDYVIFSTGAGIIDFATGEILISHALSSDETLAISQHLEHLQVDYMVHAPIPHTHQMYYRARKGGGADFRRRIKMYNDFAVQLPALTREICRDLGGATQLLCIADKNRGPQLARDLMEKLHQFSVIKATSPLDHESIWIEIFHKKSSKSAAVQWLAEKLGVAQECVCGVGNDYNDEDLLQWTGSGYIVTNGPDILKTMYTVVASNNDGGVSEAAELWMRKMHFSF